MAVKWQPHGSTDVGPGSKSIAAQRADVALTGCCCCRPVGDLLRSCEIIRKAASKAVDAAFSFFLATTC